MLRANGRNIVGCYMSRPFAHPVACCRVLLGVVAQSLKAVKLKATCKRMQQCCRNNTEISIFLLPQAS